MSGGHTPGPWMLDGGTVYALDETGNCNRFSVRPEGGWTFRSPGTIGTGGDRTTDAELDANARLIAAAPELLEACQAWLSAWGNEAEEIAAVRKMETAIAKAQGQ